ncbi:MAG: hypothetical protein AAF519_01615 [Bacteroidota bacterium]
MRKFFWLNVLFLVACTTEEARFGEATVYFPPYPRLVEGVVNKYYEHYDFGSDREPLMLASYVEYKLISPNQLRETHYGGGFNPLTHYVYRFDSSKQVLVKEIFYYDSDTLEAEVIENVKYDWVSSNAVLNKVRHYPDGDFKIEVLQKNIQNQVVSDGRDAKVFTSFTKTDWNTKERTTEITAETVYARNLGLYSKITDRENVKMRMELIEQMPIEKFEKLKNHGIRRVGYIDSAKVLSEEPFSLCNPFDNLADYYNSDPDGRYSEDKNGLEEALRSFIDQDLLSNESGFLTFRFIVNCEGEAGRFVAEGVDVNYQPKEYPKEIVSHVYDAMRSLGAWRPVVIQGQARDAHFYITFKLKNGEITDILP